MDPILVITNASAGSNEVESLQAALTVLEEAAEVVLVETSKPEELSGVLRAFEGSVVVVAGGDGSLHAVVNALHREDLLGSICLGLVPLGTGNDFARGVGIPLEPAEAARLVVSGDQRPTDLIVDDTGLVVVNNAHLGVGAQASRAAEKWKPRLGRLGYVVGAVRAATRPRFIRARVDVDGRALPLRPHIAQLAIGNGGRVGGGTELIPGADPGDGVLVVIVSRAVGLRRRLAYLVRLRGGTHHLMDEVSRITGQRVTVEGEKFWLVSDGEISGPHRRRSWELRAGAVAMFRPPLPEVQTEGIEPDLGLETGR